MQHHKPQLDDLFLTRREFLCRCGMGMGALSLASFFGGVEAVSTAAQAAGGYVSPLMPRQPQFPSKTKHVIHIFANGGPSHVDTFDPKPALEKYAGKQLPMENLKTERKTGAAFPSPYKFKRYGQSGIGNAVVSPCVANTSWTDGWKRPFVSRLMVRRGSVLGG